MSARVMRRRSMAAASAKAAALASPVALFDRHWFELPDVVRVFANGSITGEFSDTGRVENGLLGPAGRVAIRRVDPGLRVAISAEICQHEERIAVVHERAMQLGKRVGLAWGPVIAPEPVDDGAQFLVVIVIVAWVVAFRVERFDLFDGQTEDEDVVVAD